MITDDCIPAVAALLADGTRVRMLCAVADGRALPAGELARRAGVGAPTASAHLNRLVDAGFLAVQPGGRHRYYRLANPAVVSALEALGALARPGEAPLPYRQAHAARAIHRARSCYDHLAGRLGVDVTEALVGRGALERDGREFRLSAGGEALLDELGVDHRAARSGRRSFARACLDWSERRDHLAGALGAAVLHGFLRQGWIERTAESRAVRITGAGRRALRGALGVDAD
jgi:DNA-binding transcriptional ArsR family regulator